MASNRSIKIQALTLGTDIIDLGGDNEAARITFGDQATATRGVSQTIFNEMVNPDATLTIVCYPEDACHRQLVRREARLEAARRRGVYLPDPGSSTNGLNGESTAWTDARCTQKGDMLLSQDTSTVTWIYALSKVKRVML